MAGKIFDNIVNMIEKRTKEKISPIQNEKIQNISISQKPDSGYARGDLIPVNFYVNIISLNDSINAKINFNIAQTDENGNPVKVLIYKIYRDTENEEGERAGFPELIAEISSSLITSGVFSFNDNGFPMGNVVYYTITCVDTTGFESPFGEWQRYEDSYPEINNLQLKDFEILEDKSVKINFDIELLRNYSHGFEEMGKEIETNNFLELLDFVQVREGNLLIDQFEELSYRFYPDKFSTTLNFRPRTKRGTVSSESLELKIGGTSPDISFDIGSLNAGSCSAEEDVYVNADGSSVSRIKLNLVAGSVTPSEVLIKARRKAIPPASQESYFIVYDGAYESELMIEQGASTGWNKKQVGVDIGVDYQIQVFVKTSWGLIKDSPDYAVELKIEGNTEAPTPVYFVDSNGDEIETMTTSKYFELNWGESADFDDDLYVIKISKPEISTWENADHLYTGRATKFVYIPTPEQFATYNTNGTIRFWIKSYNARGIAQTTARTIDITNNAPSKQSAPTISGKNGGIRIFAESLEADIEGYKIEIEENGIILEDTILSKSNSYDYLCSPDNILRARVKGIDIYGQVSEEWSEWSDAINSFISFSDDMAYVYPSGDTSGETDAQTLNLIFSALIGGNGGAILFSGGTFYIDNQILNCKNNTKRVSLISEGKNTLLEFLNTGITYSDRIAFDVSGDISGFRINSPIGELIFNNNVMAKIEDVSFESSSTKGVISGLEIRNCHNTSLLSALNLIESSTSENFYCDFGLIQNCKLENYTIGGGYVTSFRIKNLTFIGSEFEVVTPNTNNVSEVDWSGFNFSGVSSGAVVQIKQPKYGLLSGNFVVDGFNLFIYQETTGTIRDLTIELRSNNDVKIYQRRIGSIFAPYRTGIYNSRFYKTNNGVSGSIYVYQGYTQQVFSYFTDAIWWLQNTYIDGDTETLSVSGKADMIWNNNVITGTTTDNTFVPL